MTANFKTIDDVLIGHSKQMLQLAQLADKHDIRIYELEAQARNLSFKLQLTWLMLIVVTFLAILK